MQPVAPAATSTPTTAPTDLPTQTPTPTVTPTSTATPTATPTHTPSPTATPSPTLTPTPLPTLEQRPTATPLPFYRVAEQESRRQPSLLLASGFGSLILALVAGLVLLVSDASAELDNLPKSDFVSGANLHLAGFVALGIDDAPRLALGQRHLARENQKAGMGDHAIGRPQAVGVGFV